MHNKNLRLCGVASISIKVWALGGSTSQKQCQDSSTKSHCARAPIKVLGRSSRSLRFLTTQTQDASFEYRSCDLTKLFCSTSNAKLARRRVGIAKQCGRRVENHRWDAVRRLYELRSENPNKARFASSSAGFSAGLICSAVRSATKCACKLIRSVHGWHARSYAHT